MTALMNIKFLMKVLMSVVHERVCVYIHTFSPQIRIGVYAHNQALFLHFRFTALPFDKLECCTV